MSKSLTQIPKNLGFRLRFPCLKTAKKWSDKFELPAKHSLPSLGQFEDQNEFVDWRGAWNEEGLFFTVIVTGKQQSMWCRQTAMLESDGVQIWLDTRDTHNVHRATRFCHWFLAMPLGGGSTDKEPIVTMLKINRAREDSTTIGSRALKVTASKKKDGYKLSVFIPKAALNGWNLGRPFTARILDRSRRQRNGLANNRRRPRVTDLRRPQPVAHARFGRVGNCIRLISKLFDIRPNWRYDPN